MATAVQWLRETCPTTQAERVRAARIHLQNVEEISELDAAIFGTTKQTKVLVHPPVQLPSDTSDISRRLTALEHQNSSSSNLLMRLDWLEERERERSLEFDRKISLLREERDRAVSVAAKASCAIDELRARIDAIEVRNRDDFASSEAVRAVAAAAEAKAEAAQSAVSRSLRAERQTDAKLQEFMVKSEARLATYESSLMKSQSSPPDENILIQATVTQHQVAAKQELLGERLARLEEQTMQSRRSLDDLRVDQSVDLSEVKAANQTDHELLSAIDHRLNATVDINDERYSQLHLKIESLATDLAFAREQLARIEQQQQHQNVPHTQPQNVTEVTTAKTQQVTFLPPPYESDDDADASVAISTEDE